MIDKLDSFFFFSSRRRHTRCGRDWSSDVCSSDLHDRMLEAQAVQHAREIEYGVATQLVCGAGQLREAAIGVARHCSPSCRARQPYAEGAAAPQKWARRTPCAKQWASS